MGKRKKTHDEFIREVQELVLGEYVVLGQYHNTDEKILFLHVSCGKNFKMSPHDFLSGHRCSICYGTHKKTTKQIKREVLDLVGREYTIIGDYTGALSKITFYHSNCCYEFEMTPASFLSGQRCPRCRGCERKTSESFRLEVRKLVGDEYEVLGEYYTSKNKIMFLHLTCGYEFEMIPNGFLRGQRCPVCALKQTQSRLATYLKQYFSENYNSLTEYNECVNPKTGKYLPYDIYIPSHKAYIEIQGRQHYRRIKAWHKTVESFEYQQYRDSLKKKHAEDNGIYIEIDILKHSFKSAVEYITDAVGLK